MQIVSMFRPGISVVVVNYKTSGDLQKFCASFEENRTDDSELIIVNVDPEPVDIEVALKAPYAQHIVAQTNVGYASACNRAAKQTDREIIAFFNADTLLMNNCLAECSKALLDHDDWGILGPRQIDHRGRITHAGIVGTLDDPHLRGWMQHDSGQFSEVIEDCVSVMGSAYFVKRRVWDELNACPLYRDVASHAEGAFLPTQHYYEETWCSYHAVTHGWKVVYYGPVVMEHRWHKASPMGGFADAMFNDSRIYFRKACDHHNILHD